MGAAPPRAQPLHPLQVLPSPPAPPPPPAQLPSPRTPLPPHRHLRTVVLLCRAAGPQAGFSSEAIVAFLCPPDGPNPLMALNGLQAQAMELALARAGVPYTEVAAVRGWKADLKVRGRACVGGEGGGCSLDCTGGFAFKGSSRAWEARAGLGRVSSHGRPVQGVIGAQGLVGVGLQAGGGHFSRPGAAGAPCLPAAAHACASSTWERCLTLLCRYAPAAGGGQHLHGAREVGLHAAGGAEGEDGFGGPGVWGRLCVHIKEAVP